MSRRTPTSVFGPSRHFAALRNLVAIGASVYKLTRLIAASYDSRNWLTYDWLGGNNA